MPALLTSTSKRPVRPPHGPRRPRRLGCQRRRRPAPSRRSRGRCAGRLGLEVDDVDGGAGGLEPRGDRAADATRGAGDHDGAAGEVEGEVGHHTLPVALPAVTGGFPPMCLDPVDRSPQTGGLQRDDDTEQRGVQQLRGEVRQRDHCDHLRDECDRERARKESGRRTSSARERYTTQQSCYGREDQRLKAGVRVGGGEAVAEQRASQRGQDAGEREEQHQGGFDVDAGHPACAAVSTDGTELATDTRSAEHEGGEAEDGESDQASWGEDSGDCVVDPERGLDVG